MIASLLKLILNIILKLKVLQNYRFWIKAHQPKCPKLKLNVVSESKTTVAHAYLLNKAEIIAELNRAWLSCLAKIMLKIPSRRILDRIWYPVPINTHSDIYYNLWPCIDYSRVRGRISGIIQHVSNISNTVCIWKIIGK